jgi:16S rRNA (adenine1518-N6/adenine1519-N6)-dimethyltransferase
MKTDCLPCGMLLTLMDFWQKKTLGQNFITDLNLTMKIARLVDNLENSIIYEVGPGPGALTRGLLLCGAKKVIAVEMDHRCLDALNDVKNVYTNRLDIHEGDALKVDELALIGDTGGAPIHIVANLPYNIGTALLVKWMTLQQWTPWFTSLTLMFQKEVGMRIIAKPRTKSYGRLSVLNQYRSKARILFDLPPQAFTPAPKVTSCVVQIVPHAEANNTPKQKVLEKLVSCAFNQRRKMLRASLKQMGVDPSPKLKAVNIEETSRAEELSVEDFCRLAREYE